MSFSDGSAENKGSSLIVSRVFGAIASTVIGYALYQSAIVATAADWSEFYGLVQTDRSYLAFCIDPILFALFQPFLLMRVKNELQPIDYIPLFGLIHWLFTVEPVSTSD